MARTMLCDAGDDREAVYLVTDLTNGDATAWCQEHFTDLCANVTRAAEDALEVDELTPHPQDLDNPGDEPPAVVTVDSPAAPDGYVELVPPIPAELVGDKIHAELDQRDRTRRKLADRPDSAATSLDVVPEPGSPRR